MNIFNQTAKTVAETGKVLLAVTTQVAVLGTTAVNAAKDNSSYVKRVAEGSVAEAVSADRALADNRALVEYVKDKASYNDTTTVPVV